MHGQQNIKKITHVLRSRSCSVHLLTLKIKASRSFATSVGIYQSTRRTIPGELKPQQHNSKPQILPVVKFLGQKVFRLDSS